MKLGLLLLFLLSFSPWVSAGCCYQSEVDLVGQAGNFRGGGGAYGWVPVKQNSYSVLFAQGGGGYFRHQLVGTAGIGYRRLLGSTFAVGVNGFADISVTEHGSIYRQLGGGFELLTCHALFRFNGYAPFGGRNTIFSQPGATLNQTSIIGLDLNRFEVPLPGFDLEGGGGFCLGPGEVWGYAGYFWHKRDEIRPVWGPRLRLEYRYDLARWPVQLIFGGWWEHDRLHGTTASLAVELRLPYCRCSRRRSSSLCELMGRPVFRDRALWVDDFGDEVSIGQVGTLIFANNAINGSGTQTNPATIANAFAIAGPSDIVFLLQDTGNMTPAVPIILDPFQQVLGFGDSNEVTISTANGATLTITDLTGAGRGIVDGSVALTAFEAADQTLFQGIGITLGGIGINIGPGVDHVTITDVNFDSQVGTSIFSDGGRNLFVRDSTMTSGGSGVRAFESTGILEVWNSSITSPTGISLEDVRLDRAVMSRNTISATISGVLFQDVGGGPYVINESTITGAVRGVLVDDTFTPGIPKDIRVLNTDILSVTLHGIDVLISAAPDIYQFNGNRITGNSDEAILMNLDLGPLNVEIIGNELTSVLEDALLIDADAGATILIERNSGTAAEHFIDVSFGGASNVQGNVTILCNQVFNAPVGFAGYRVDRAAATTEPICATILGNNKVVPADGIVVATAVTPIFVFDLPNLSANNNNLGVTLFPPVMNTPTRCPLPVIPPLNFPI